MHHSGSVRLAKPSPQRTCTAYRSPVSRRARPQHHFRTWLGCVLSEMTTAQLGDEHASPTDVWLSPNARDEPPSHPRGVIRITCKLYLKNSILHNSAIEQNRQAEDRNEHGREPGPERGSACR